MCRVQCFVIYVIKFVTKFITKFITNLPCPAMRVATIQFTTTVMLPRRPASSAVVVAMALLKWVLGSIRPAQIFPLSLGKAELPT